MLEPTSPLYEQIGSDFIKLQMEIYGTDHIYQTDTYNEMDPKTSDPDYLQASSRAVYNAMKIADPSSVWLMQGWLFKHNFWQEKEIKAYLEGVPKGGMIVLDLAANSRPVWQKSQSFYGHQFIWCTLLVFGGKQGMFGNVNAIGDGISTALESSLSTMAGVGITMEGIWTNYPVFEFTLQAGWEKSVLYKGQDYFDRYSVRRYNHAPSGGAVKAWQVLADKIYGENSQGFTSSMIEVDPCSAIGEICTKNGHSWSKSGGSEGDLGNVKAMLNQREHMPSKGISADATNQAWKMLLESKDDLENAQSFRFDLVDVARQSMSAIFAIIAQNDFVPSIKAKNVSAAQTAANKLLDLIGDFDALLNTNENFMLGPWIQWAREWGEGQGEEVGNWYEFNARNQLTLWGPDGNINDYARKAWGLVQDYYLHRWKYFVELQIKSISDGKEFDSKAYEAAMLSFGQNWSNKTRPIFPTSAVGDTIDIASHLYSKWVL